MKKLIFILLSLIAFGCSSYVCPTYAQGFIQCKDNQNTAIYFKGEIIHFYTDRPMKGKKYFANWYQLDYVRYDRDTIENPLTKSKHYFRVTQDTVYFDKKKLPIKKGG